ncbi:MAG: OmpA family protein [Acidobacteriales bacterium]|nr:OmpA family protein [Terriglobales bacterium]
MNTPDKGIPTDLFEKAQCIVIVPGLKKGAFGWGGKYGRGFASCRHGDRGWGAPAGIRIEGGSFGFQIGGSSTDVVMLVMNESGMNRLLADKFTLGGQAAAVAGPVGRETSANTDVLATAEILSWSRSHGLFAGVSLEGATLRPDGDENEKLYEKAMTNKEILQGGVQTPHAARMLICELDEFTKGVTSPCGNATARSLEFSGRARLSEIHFATNKADILPDSEPALSQALAALKDNPSWKVRIEGYTDNVGSASANRKLSEDRANAVADWLASHGVDRARLKTRGYGETHPIADNSTDEGRAKNRRVELVRMR